MFLFTLEFFGKSVAELSLSIWHFTNASIYRPRIRKVKMHSYTELAAENLKRIYGYMRKGDPMPVII